MKTDSASIAIVALWRRESYSRYLNATLSNAVQSQFSTFSVNRMTVIATRIRSAEER
jgi:hypothetical protein